MSPNVSRDTASKLATGRREPACPVATFAGTVLVSPAAHAAQPEPEGGSTTSAASFDIGEYVAERKEAMAQDRVDRPELYQY